MPHAVSFIYVGPWVHTFPIAIGPLFIFKILDFKHQMRTCVCSAWIHVHPHLPYPGLTYCQQQKKYWTNLL